MIGIADWTSRGKNLCQDLLALFERDAPQIVAVNVDEIEDVVQHRNVAAGIYATSMLTDAGALLHQAERCTALFSLMQQRTGIREHGRRVDARGDIPVLYYVFDLIYVDGYDLRRVSLEERKQVLAEILTSTGPVRYSDHFDQGTKLFEAAKQQGIEGIVA